jgi:hypothetical protein
MLGVTCFGLLFTPAFYTFIRKLGHKDHEAAGGYSISRATTVRCLHLTGENSEASQSAGRRSQARPLD